MGFVHHKTFGRLAEVPRVRFDHQKWCRKLVEVVTVRFDHRKCVGRLLWFEVCVLTTANRVVGLPNFG